jgi:hypothetical protein
MTENRMKVGLWARGLALSSLLVIGHASAADSGHRAIASYPLEKISRTSPGRFTAG